MAEGRRGAFALDVAVHAAAAAAKAAWWTAAGRAARAMVRPTKGEQATEFQPTTPPVSAKRLRAAYFAAFEKDARDARALADAGFTLERVLPVDQFLWSPHIELVGIFTR